MDEPAARSLCREIFGSENGKAFLDYLEKFAMVNNAEYVSDDKLMSYLRGRWSVCCEIRRLLEDKKR